MVRGAGPHGDAAIVIFNPASEARSFTVDLSSLPAQLLASKVRPMDLFTNTTAAAPLAANWSVDIEAASFAAFAFRLGVFAPRKGKFKACTPSDGYNKAAPSATTLQACFLACKKDARCRNVFVAMDGELPRWLEKPGHITCTLLGAVVSVKEACPETGAGTLIAALPGSRPLPTTARAGVGESGNVVHPSPSARGTPAGVCRVQTNSSAWGEFGSRNAYTADGGVHKFSVCSGNKGPWAWQSTGNITVKECAARAKGLGAKCWDFLCPYKFAADCTCPPRPTAKPVAKAATVACVGDSITAGYLSSCGLNYPNQLQVLLGNQYNVTNYGVGGRTMFKQQHLPPGDMVSYWNTTQYHQALASASDIVVLMLGTNDAKDSRWAMSSHTFPTDYADMARSFLALSPKPKLYVMVPPPLYRDGRYNMNQTVINSLFPGSGPAAVRTIAEALGLPTSQVIDIYSLFQKQCPVAGGTPGHAPNATDVPCDWIGWCSGVNSTQCLGIDGCHPNDVGYGHVARLVHAAISSH